MAIEGSTWRHPLEGGMQQCHASASLRPSLRGRHRRAAARTGLHGDRPVRRGTAEIGRSQALSNRESGSTLGTSLSRLCSFLDQHLLRLLLCILYSHHGLAASSRWAQCRQAHTSLATALRCHAPRSVQLALRCQPSCLSNSTSNSTWHGFNIIRNSRSSLCATNPRTKRGPHMPGSTHAYSLTWSLCELTPVPHGSPSVTPRAAHLGRRSWVGRHRQAERLGLIYGRL